jgi:uncharacterized protein DUF6247
MAATATKVPFSDAAPAELREVILPEDVPEFDRQFQEALDAARETLRLDALEEFLAHYRRIAWAVSAHGRDQWRALLERAKRTLRTGELPPGTASAEEMRAKLRERQAARA